MELPIFSIQTLVAVSHPGGVGGTVYTLVGLFDFIHQTVSGGGLHSNILQDHAQR